MSRPVGPFQTPAALLPIQAKNVRVSLWGVKVDSLLYYAGAFRTFYIMFLSSGGFPIIPPITTTFAHEVIRGLQAIADAPWSPKHPRPPRLARDHMGRL